MVLGRYRHFLLKYTAQNATDVARFFILRTQQKGVGYFYTAATPSPLKKTKNLYFSMACMFFSLLARMLLTSYGEAI